MTDLACSLEAVLFTAHEPLNLEALAELLQVDESRLAAAVDELTAYLAASGLRLSQHPAGIRLVTAPEHDEIITRALTKGSRAELTKPALETLSIVAYRGPVTRSGIETIRGVNSEAILRNLLGRGLITTHTERSPEPGRPPQYIVSTEFLDHFGLTTTRELPTITPSEAVHDPA